MLQRDQSSRSQLDRLSREFGFRILPVWSKPGRVQQGRAIYVKSEDKFYIGMQGEWRPLVPDADVEYSSKIEADR